MIPNQTSEGYLFVRHECLVSGTKKPCKTRSFSAVLLSATSPTLRATPRLSSSRATSGLSEVDSLKIARLSVLLKKYMKLKGRESHWAELASGFSAERFRVGPASNGKDLPVEHLVEA